MILVVTATEAEMTPLRSALAREPGVEFLVTGMGPVETALQLTRYLATVTAEPVAVINAGVAGAFIGTGLELLDICLAEYEVFADLGICLDDEIEGFSEDRLPVRIGFPLRNRLLTQAEAILVENGIVYRKGIFLTVSCVSGTAGRGNYLRDRHRAICENMEGAAIARVCEEYSLPCLELRCISNLVEDRDESRWQLKKAFQGAGRAAAAVVKGLLREGGD